MEPQVQKIVLAAFDKRPWLNQESRGEILGMIESTLEKGKISAKELGIGEAEKEFLYKEASKNFASGKYAEALQQFTHLTILFSGEFSFAFGIAASFQALKAYDEAACYYVISAELAPMDPVPLHHLAYCWLKLDKWPAAIDALEKMLNLCKGRKKYAELLSRGELEIKQIRDEHSNFFNW